MMIVDMNQALKSVADVQEDLDKLGEEIGVAIKCQHEDIFNSMHKI